MVLVVERDKIDTIDDCQLYRTPSFTNDLPWYIGMGRYISFFMKISKVICVDGGLVRRFYCSMLYITLWG